MNRLWSFFLFAVLVSLTWWLLRDPTTDTPADLTPTIERSEPDLYGENVQFNQLHPNGQLHYRLVAKHIQQFEKDQLTRLKIPKLHLRSATQAPWDIQAEEGFIRTESEDTVFLREAVRMQQQSPRGGQVILKSDSFYLYPDRQFAETHQDVTIDTEVGRTTAAGLQANLETGLLVLKSSTTQRVHTIVLPEQFKN